MKTPIPTKTTDERNETREPQVRAARQASRTACVARTKLELFQVYPFIQICIKLKRKFGHFPAKT
jgi:hypothetical protein